MEPGNGLVSMEMNYLTICAVFPYHLCSPSPSQHPRPPNGQSTTRTWELQPNAHARRRTFQIRLRLPHLSHRLHVLFLKHVRRLKLRGHICLRRVSLQHSQDLPIIRTQDILILGAHPIIDRILGARHHLFLQMHLFNSHFYPTIALIHFHSLLRSRFSRRLPRILIVGPHLPRDCIYRLKMSFSLPFARIFCIMLLKDLVNLNKI